jgi:hypothetical protein
MKTIKVELPDGTLCAFVNYVFQTGTGLSMGARSISTNDLDKGELVFK